MPTRKQKAIKLLSQDCFMFGFITSWFPAGLWTWQCNIISKYLRKIWQISSLATVPTDNQSFHWPAIKNQPIKEILKLLIHCVYVTQNFFGETISLYVFFWVFPRRLNFQCRRFGTLFHLHLPSYAPTCLWRWNIQSVPKRQHIKFRRRRITHKKIYNIQTRRKFEIKKLYPWFQTFAVF